MVPRQGQTGPPRENIHPPSAAGPGQPPVAASKKMDERGTDLMYPSHRVTAPPNWAAPCRAGFSPPAWRSGSSWAKAFLPFVGLGQRSALKTLSCELVAMWRWLEMGGSQKGDVN